MIGQFIALTSDLWLMAYCRKPLRSDYEYRPKIKIGLKFDQSKQNSLEIGFLSSDWLNSNPISQSLVWYGL